MCQSEKLQMKSFAFRMEFLNVYQCKRRNGLGKHISLNWGKTAEISEANNEKWPKERNIVKGLGMAKTVVGVLREQLAELLVTLGGHNKI